MAGDILAANGRPFRDRDAAEVKRQTLAAELDEHFLVVDHPDGGFAVRRDAGTGHPARFVTAESSGEASVSEIEHRFYDIGPSPLDELEDEVAHAGVRREPRDPLPNTESRSASQRKRSVHDDAPAREAAVPRTSRAPSSSYRDAFRLHPAPRAFLFQHLFSFLGVIFMFQPHRIFGIAGVSLPENPELAGVALGFIALAGLAIALLSTGRFLWEYLSNTYVVTPHSVQQIRWYFDGVRLRRAKPQIDFAHLRTIDVDQGLIQMLLGVGHVRMATGGTDTHEIILEHVLGPAELASEFRRRYTDATGRRLDQVID